MRIQKLTTNPKAYSSNVYYIRGDYNALEDINTLIDTGADEYIFDELSKIFYGAGKRSVEQIILTHNHFDHTGGLKFLQELYKPKILAFHDDKSITKVLRDDDVVKIGDKYFHVIYTPGHSNDSICLYGYDDKVLFSGDTPIDVKTKDATYSLDFICALKRIASMKIETIYPGHGNPYTQNVQEILQRT